MRGELGVLSLSARLKKIPSNSQFNALEIDKLGQFVTNEYEEHYNSPVIGGDNDWGLGINTEIRRKTEKQSMSLSSPFTEEEMDQQLSLRLANYGFPPIPPHQNKEINERNWIFYLDHGQGKYITHHYYCLPIDKEYYLCLGFGYRKDQMEKFKLWKSDAEAAEKRIMEMVEVKFPEKAHG
jgi:hypothetical protein